MSSRFAHGKGASWRQRFLAIARQAGGAVAAERIGRVGLRPRPRSTPLGAGRRLRFAGFPARTPVQG